MKKSIFIIGFTLLFFTLHSQNISISNQNTFGGSFTDQVRDAVMINNSYLVGGYSLSPVSGDKTDSIKGQEDFWLVNFSSSLNSNWQKTIGGDSTDILEVIIQTQDGNILCGGSSSSTISGDKTAQKKGKKDYWIMKLDINGDILWDKSYGGTGFDILTSIIEFNDGTLLLCGRSNSDASGDKTDSSRGAYDYWIVKTDAAGNIEWDKSIGGSGFDFLTNAQINSKEEIVLSGTSNSPISGEKSEGKYGLRDIWVVKIDTVGNIIWDKTLGGADTDVSAGFGYNQGGYISIENNNIYVVASSDANISGTKTEGSKGSDDYWVTKLDDNGNIIWDKTVGGGDIEYASSSIINSEGHLLISGSSFSGISGDKTESNIGHRDFWLVAMDSSGNIQWQKTLGGSDWDELVKTIEISTGNYLLAGFSQSDVSGDKAESNIGLEDYWLVELDVHNGINELQQEFSVSVFPNPSSGDFTIDLPKNGQLVISDLVGREVYRQNLHFGKNNVQTENLRPGTYLLTVLHNHQIIDTKKLLLSK